MSFEGDAEDAVAVILELAKGGSILLNLDQLGLTSPRIRRAGSDCVAEIKAVAEQVFDDRE